MYVKAASRAAVTFNEKGGRRGRLFCGLKVRVESDAGHKGSRSLETIEVHHLVPGSHEVANKFLLAVDTGINFGQGAEF